MSKTNQESTQEVIDTKETNTKKKKDLSLLATVEKITKAAKKKTESNNLKKDKKDLDKKSEEAANKTSEISSSDKLDEADKNTSFKSEKKKAEKPEKKKTEKPEKKKAESKKSSKKEKSKEDEKETEKIEPPEDLPAENLEEVEKKSADKSEKKKAEKPEKKKTEKPEKKKTEKPEKKKAESKKSSKKEKSKEDEKETEKIETPEDLPAENPEDIEKKSADKSEKKKAEKPEKKKSESKSDKTSEKTEKKKKDQKSDKKKEEKPKTEKKKSEKWSIKQLGGYLFAKMLRGGASELHANADEVNKLNVFPVPDGDTGDNMTMTIESGVASLDNIDTDDLAEVLKVASRGMLLGARGNSGVILSQFFAGMAKGLENVETADAKKLAHALEVGVQQAYTSVMTPTEGTILTVAREAVEYAVSRVNSKSTVQTLFSDLVNEMNASLERTPEILPILGEAGVVDSGGAGLLYIIDGLNRVLNGEDIEDSDISHLPRPKSGAIENASFGPDSEMEFGYCTELLVQLMNKKIAKNPFNLDSLKLYLASLGDSIVAFQTDLIVKIHVHTLRPDRVLGYMRKYGEFISVKIENMSLQHTELTENNESKNTEAIPPKKYGIVAVSSGDGITNLFKELGVDEIVEGGQTNNPSTSDFIESFDKINAENILVLPNNGNIIMAASQAAEIYDKAKVYVVPTKSIGAGYVALSTMNLEFSEPDDVMVEATEAVERITSAYISPAVRDADMNGVHITDGDTMGIIAKEIVISGPDKMTSTYGLIDIMLHGGDKFMLTVFFGKDATPEERSHLSEYISSTYPNIEAYFIDGEQEIYPFLFVAE